MELIQNTTKNTFNECFGTISHNQQALSHKGGEKVRWEIFGTMRIIKKISLFKNFSLEVVLYALCKLQKLVTNLWIQFLVALQHKNSMACNLNFYTWRHCIYKIVLDILSLPLEPSSLCSLVIDVKSWRKTEMCPLWVLFCLKYYWEETKSIPCCMMT